MVDLAVAVSVRRESGSGIGSAFALAFGSTPPGIEWSVSEIATALGFPINIRGFTVYSE